MTKERKYEVCGEDKKGNLWTVATALWEMAEYFAEQFRRDGFRNVHIVKN